MARHGLGDYLHLAGTFLSVLTVIIGLIYAAAKPPTLKFKWSECGWTNPDEYTLWVDCNQQWQSSWGMTALPNYTPLILGIIGVAMWEPSSMEVFGFPRNFWQYGIFLILQGFVGDFGYCSKFGVVVGYLSCILGGICFVAAFFEVFSRRMRDIRKKFPLKIDEDLIEAFEEPTETQPRASAAPSADDLFSKIDKDGDGVLTREELAAAGYSYSGSRLG
mmetsp:Transcript_17519/g.32963  ORF Transcript_17519/g.32963 Transcript_17519/m.32963 type:complete len:219 (-) Transcript_17519:120-776(-)